jgi:hypothetical protein
MDFEPNFNEHEEVDPPVGDDVPASYEEFFQPSLEKFINGPFFSQTCNEQKNIRSLKNHFQTFNNLCNSKQQKQL